MPATLTLEYDFYNDSSIYGVYHNRYLTFQGSNSSSTINYIDVDVSYNSTSTNLKLYTNTDNTAYLDVHKIIESLFSSDVNNISTDIISYSLSATAYWADSSTSSNSVSEERVLNGIKQSYDNYIFNENTVIDLSTYNRLPKFLSEQSQNYLYIDTSLYNEIGDSEVNEMDLYFINESPNSLILPNWETNAYVQLPYSAGGDPNIDVRGNSSVSCKMILNKDLKTEQYSVLSGGNGVFNLCKKYGYNDYSRIGLALYGRQMVVNGWNEDTSSNWYMAIDVSDMSRQYLDINIEKNSAELLSFTINGVERDFAPAVGYANAIITTEIGKIFSYYLTDAYIWDVQVTKNGTPTHLWNGYANPDVSTAWVDQIGTADGSVMLGLNPGTLDYVNAEFPIRFNINTFTKDSSASLILGAESGVDIDKIELDHKNINSILPEAITSETLYYTVQEENEYSDIFTFTIRQPNKLNDKYFRLAWVNEDGGINYYNFDYNYQKTIDIDKTVFNTLSDSFDQRYKYFNTETEITYTITTNWISETDSRYLESLWKSPSVKATAHYFKSTDYFNDLVDGKLIEDKYIILNVKSMDIKRRRNGLINYTIEFTIADKQINQKN